MSPRENNPGVGIHQGGVARAVLLSALDAEGPVRIAGIEEPALSAFEHGVLYGLGLFETIAVLEGRPAFLGRHLERLVAAAPAIGIPVPDHRVLTRAVQTALTLEAHARTALRLTLTAGPALPLPAAETPAPLLLATLRPAGASPPDGLRVITCTGTRRNSRSPFSRLKVTGAPDLWLARREARAAGVDEALLLNERDEVAEASTANIFAIRAGRLVTPPLASGAIPGIARGRIIAWAARHGVPVAELPLVQDDLAAADEIWLTNAVRGVMPVITIDGRQVGGGLPGPVGIKAAQAFREMQLESAGNIKP